MKMRSVSGFTLIELVVVIGILAILSAIALPKFIDLRQQAANATVSGIAGAAASGSAINYGARLAGNIAATLVASCGDAARVMSGGVAPTNATFIGGTSVAVGQTTSCGVNYSINGISASASFDLVGSN